MKRKLFITLILLICLAICSCTTVPDSCQIVATVGPVFQFADRLCQGTDLQVSQLISENVSCLHDYTLQVSQMQRVESAEVVIISGAGLEEFMSDVTDKATVCIDASAGINVMSYGEDHDHAHEHEHGHHHEHDPHVWLSPVNAKIMAENICNGLSALYPGLEDTFRQNLTGLLAELDVLRTYGNEVLKDLPCRELITFHDGFAYFAHSFDLTILKAVEEESGSEASAKDLITLINLVHEHHLPAVFTEVNGSVSAAEVICRETGVKAWQLDMALASDDYFASMYRNINTIKEALK